MNYKIATDILRTRLLRYREKDGTPTFGWLTDKELLLELSIAQKYIGETYRLLQGHQNLDLVNNQSEYIVGTGVSNLKEDILEIMHIVASVNIYQPNDISYLKNRSVEEIVSKEKLSGLPTEYAFYGTDNEQKLYINSLPSSYSETNNSRLIIYYAKKLHVLFNSPDNNNSTWSDYDESDLTSGTFKIPEQYQGLMIDLALANLYPREYELYLLKEKKMMKAIPKSVSGKLTYNLSIKPDEWGERF